MPSSKGSSQPRDPTLISCLAGTFSTTKPSFSLPPIWWVFSPPSVCLVQGLGRNAPLYPQVLENDMLSHRLATDTPPLDNNTTRSAGCARGYCWGSQERYGKSQKTLTCQLLLSVARSCLTLQPHGLHYSRLRCPSLSPWVYSNSSPLSWWCHSTISSCHPVLLLPSIFPSIRVFSDESALGIRWPKYGSFSFSPSNEYSGLISFRIDWFDLLAV